MQFRELGRSGIKIAPLMLGTNVFGWNIDEKTSFSILDAFVDGGFNAVDTADSYSRWVSGHTGGESETIIGNWIKRSGKRDKVAIATVSVFGYTGFLAGPPVIGFVSQATNLRGGLLVVVLTSLTVAVLAGGFRESGPSLLGRSQSSNPGT